MSDVGDAEVSVEGEGAVDGHPAANDPLYGYTDATDAVVAAVGERDQAIAERDEIREVAQRVQADFENYKRRVDAQRDEERQRAAESLVVELLPVLDACDAAVSHGSEDGAAILSALLATLERRGLAKIDAVDATFDPEVHEAVMTEPGDGDGDPVVVEVMRPGYSWNGRVVRPAMVKVRG